MSGDCFLTSYQDVASNQGPSYLYRAPKMLHRCDCSRSSLDLDLECQAQSNSDQRAAQAGPANVNKKARPACQVVTWISKTLNPRCVILVGPFKGCVPAPPQLGSCWGYQVTQRPKFSKFS